MLKPHHSPAPGALDIFTMMYPWNWELFFTKLLSAGPAYGQVKPALCVDLAQQLRRVKAGHIETEIT